MPGMRNADPRRLEKTMTATHRSPYGGTWYPGNPAELGDLLERLSGNSVARTGEFLCPEGLHSLCLTPD